MCPSQNPNDVAPVVVDSAGNGIVKIVTSSSWYVYIVVCKCICVVCVPIDVAAGWAVSLVDTMSPGFHLYSWQCADSLGRHD